MKPFIQHASSSRRLHPILFSSPLRFSSSQAAATAATAAGDSIYSRLKQVTDPKASVALVLEGWVGEGKPIDKRDIHEIVKLLRSIKRFNQALEVSVWMTKRRYFVLSPADHATHLELIYRTQGLQHAENYFKDIPKQSKAYKVYGSLLNCCVEDKSMDKAKALFKEINELKMHNSFTYNMLIKLYSQAGKHDDVDNIFHEMQEKGIDPDTFSYNLLMDTYAGVPDIKKVEKLMEKLENHKLEMDWHFYAAAAKGFMKAGLMDKAMAAMKQSESLIPRKNNRVAYGFILTFYADAGYKDEMYRIWNKYKSSEKAFNSMYLCMISGMVKVDDIEGAEAILNEWESLFSFYEFRAPTVLIAAYCEKGLVEKAEALIRKGMENGKEPYAFTWDYLAGGYFRVNEKLKAVETMKKALSAAKPGWKPNTANVHATLDYFRIHKNVEGAEDFVKLLLNLGPVSEEINDQLAGVYLSAGKLVSDVVQH